MSININVISFLSPPSFKSDGSFCNCLTKSGDTYVPNCFFICCHISIALFSHCKVGNNKGEFYCEIMGLMCKIYLNLIQRLALVFPYLLEMAWCKSGYFLELVAQIRHARIIHTVGNFA